MMLENVLFSGLLMTDYRYSTDNDYKGSVSCQPHNGPHEFPRYLPKTTFPYFIDNTHLKFT